MAKRLNASFAPARIGLPADELGPRLYGPSLFFRAVGTFHVLHLCNHWGADMLDAAGLPTIPVLDTLAQGLLFDLRWRAGRTRRRRPGPGARSGNVGPGCRTRSCAAKPPARDDDLQWRRDAPGTISVKKM